jgi:hypothetical protein
MPTRARKSSKKRSRATTESPERCNVTPEPGPFTFPAGGGEFFILVSYPTPPDACPYTARPNVGWITTTPRISEFDVRLTPNPRRQARQGVVVVQGQANPVRHRVTIRQLGR